MDVVEEEDEEDGSWKETILPFFFANAPCCRLGLMAYERAEAVPMMRGDLMGFELSRYVRSSDCMAVRD